MSATARAHDGVGVGEMRGTQRGDATTAAHDGGHDWGTRRGGHDRGGTTGGAQPGGGTTGGHDGGQVTSDRQGRDGVV